MILSKQVLYSALLLFTISMLSFDSIAMPSFARQTGMACSSCHVQSFGPNLTPTGRNFKLNGYTARKETDSKLKYIPPISGMLRGSFTHTMNDQPGGAAERYGRNNNNTIDEASVFYAGRITSHLGAFVQGTYGGVEDKWELDNADIRMADHTTLSNNHLVYGISTNNSPSVSDLWNTTPAWGFPWASSELAPTPSAGPLIDSLGSQVIGATGYVMWRDLLYIEAGAYTMLPKNAQKGIGTFDSEQNRINGGAPYWRVALQHNWNGQYASIGAYGLQANVNPQRFQGSGTDSYYDYGFDTTYQYLGDMAHIFELNATYLREQRDMNASVALGLAEKKFSSLDIAKIRAGYTFLQTYGLNLFYTQTTGTKDQIIFSAEESITGSRTGKPNSQSFTVEVSYTPFGKSASTLATLANLRLAAQYIHNFQFNGAHHNYDGFGRNSAGNDLIYFNGWLAF
ncbi:cytochrome C [Nitrosomonas sp. JL21]|uniref:cytochrome C n=1 Tax=Nitrosomonas sp. JL21 TaxID=153949 RepID=UPI0031F350EC